MADTTNFGWTKPSAGDPGPGWVTTYNTLFDAIDADLAVAHAADGTLKDGAVDNAAVLAANVVTEAKIVDNAVTTNKIADGAVTSAKISGGYIFVPADRNADGSLAPLQSAEWAYTEKAEGGASINWNSVFGVPTTAKAVVVSAALSCAFFPPGDRYGYLKLGANEAQVETWQLIFPQASTFGDFISGSGIISVAADGTSYYSVRSPQTGTNLAVLLLVTGYFI